MLDLEIYVSLLRRWLWFLALGAVLGVAITYLGLVSLDLMPSYQATATLSVGAQFEGTNLAGDELQMGETLVPSYVVLAKRPPITQAVVGNLGLSISAEQLARYRLEVSQVGQTRIMQVTAKDPDANSAAAIANEVAKQVVQLGPVRPNEFVQIVAPAEPPGTPSLEPYLLLAIGGMVGVLLAGTLTAVIELIQDRPQTLRWAAARIDMPLLGTFTGSRGIASDRRSSEMTSPDGGFPQPEPVWWVVMATFDRALALQSGDDNPSGGHVMLVTSPEPNPSKSVAALELARAWVTTGHRIVLVDANPAQPSIDRWFNVPNQTGLSTFLTENGHSEEQLDGMLVASEIENLTLLPSGPMPAANSVLLFRKPWDRLFSIIRRKADVIIVNGAAVGSGPEVIIPAMYADAVLLVIDLGKTRAAVANNAADVFIKSGSRVLGAVVSRR